jgi:hypothetical protein
LRPRHADQEPRRFFEIAKGFVTRLPGGGEVACFCLCPRDCQQGGRRCLLVVFVELALEGVASRLQVAATHKRDGQLGQKACASITAVATVTLGGQRLRRDSSTGQVVESELGQTDLDQQAAWFDDAKVPQAVHESAVRQFARGDQFRRAV